MIHPFLNVQSSWQYKLNTTVASDVDYNYSNLTSDSIYTGSGAIEVKFE